MKKSELNPLSQDNNSAAQGSKHREHDPQLHQQVSSLLQRIQRLRRQSGPAETMDYQTLRQQYEVAANRAIEQGLGFGARELAAQREPGGVVTPDEDEGSEDGVSTEADELDESLAVQGVDDAD